MNLIFVIGTAGSGKSSFTAKFTQFLEFHREDVMAVNLDPGSIILPYAANVDVREYIKVEELMEEYGLGPNGGLMLAHDMMASKFRRRSKQRYRGVHTRCMYCGYTWSDGAICI